MCVLLYVCVFMQTITDQSLFTQSKTQQFWKSKVCPAIIWWSKWEVIKQVLVDFGDVEYFLCENEDFGLVLRPKLLVF